MSASILPLPVPQGLHSWKFWGSWESLAVNFFEIPQEVTAYDLFCAFKEKGNISNIEIYEDRHGKRTPRGRIRFSPPPYDDFWRLGSYDVKLPDGKYVHVRLRPDFNVLNQTVPSPVTRGILYPAEVRLSAAKLDFGVRVGVSTTYPMRSFDREANVFLTVNVKMRAFIVHFQIRMFRSGVNPKDAEIAKFRFKIPFHQLGRIWESTDTFTKDLSFLIFLDTPPVFHRQVKDIEATFDDSETMWREGDTWIRQTTIVHGHGRIVAPISLRRRGQFVDLGRWNAIKMTFSTEDLCGELPTLLHAVLKDHNIMFQDGNIFKESANPPVPVWQWIDSDVKTVKDTPFHMLGDLLDREYLHLAFPVRYQLEVCISNGYLSEFTMGREFVAKLLEVGEAKAQRLLEHVATNQQFFLNPMEIFDLEVTKGATDSKIPAYCCFMRTARVTPTTIYYNTPTVDTSNRITRRYIEFADRFLRVRFTDEKTQGRINSSSGSSNDEIFRRVKAALSLGIKIGDRHYEFLAFGNSQFREHGAYFFAPLPDLSASHIRAWMGQFSHIRNVAKHTARLGQCFSTTRAVAGSPVTVTRIPDIVRGNYCFSDGIGKISKFIAQMAMNELKIKPPAAGYPSAFQFRLGGCKGMLAISPDANPKEVHIRPSQIKFESEHVCLEIIRWSQFGIATLNRQLIHVLSARGVSDRIFEKRLHSMLEDVDKAMKNDTHAIELLQKFVDPSQMTLTVAQMVSDGFKARREPFVDSLLSLWQAWHLKGLKEKAKIVIDQGANLLGVLDETGTLKGCFNTMKHPNTSYAEELAGLPEIFVQICRPGKEEKSEIVQGVCILARNPSLHPGDIRIVRAVDCPKLRHLHDVIVFPQTGDRDLASMCSGGDLDGDDYLVIWDQDLIPKFWGVPPMESTRPKETTLLHDVTVDDITTFFTDYMKNDCLPRIAHAHMAQADWLRDGVLEDKCIRLAQLHSDAVDYNKTGRIAIMTRDLEPRKWPHFMEKRFKRHDQIYHSNKILGQLYDMVERIHFNPKLDMPFDARILESTLVPRSEVYLEYAEQLKTEYDASMLRIMAQFEITTEFEVWSTFVLNHNSLCRDYKIYEDLGRISGTLRAGFRKQCYEKVNGRLFEDIAPLAIAMYRVTSKQMESALEAQQDHALEDYDDHESIDSLMGDESLPLISFPWIFHEVLGKIAKGNFQLSETPGEDKNAPTEESCRKIYTQDDVKQMLATFQCDDTAKDALKVVQGEVLTMSPDERQPKRTEICDSDNLIPHEKTAEATFAAGDDHNEIHREIVKADPESDSDDGVQEIIEDEANIKQSAVDTLLNLINS